MFVLTNEGYINLDHVTQIKPFWKNGGDTKHILYGRDGRSLGSTEDPDFDLEALTAPIVPAAPGTTIVIIGICHSNGGARPAPDDLWREEVPVLAWRCMSRGAEPVIWDQDSLKHDTVFHRMPGGSLMIPGGCSYETRGEAEQAILEHAQEGWDLRHAEREGGVA